MLNANKWDLIVNSVTRKCDVPVKICLKRKSNALFSICRKVVKFNQSNFILKKI